MWGLLRIPARGNAAAPKGHTAIGREEKISQLDGQTLVAGSGLRTLLDSTATTGTSLIRKRPPLGPYCRPTCMPRVLGGHRGLGVFLWARYPCEPFRLQAIRLRVISREGLAPLVSSRCRCTHETLAHGFQQWRAHPSLPFEKQNSLPLTVLPSHSTERRGVRLQGYLALEKTRPPWDHHRALAIGPLQGPGGGGVL